jgi:hypothetical protein
VQALNLAQVADELYALAPAAFRTARDERAGQARAAGDADLADEIRMLRRPTVSAWVVNLLVREAPGQVGELLELGESLREAQQALAGDRLRDLSAQRRRLVTAMSQEAKRLAAQAGQSLSAQVEREVQDTIEAALADPGIADAVRSGRLTKALSYAGLGEGVGVGDAVAVWPTPVGRPPQQSQVAPSHARERREQAAPAKREARQHPATSQRPAREAGAAGRGRRKARGTEHDRREAEAAERERREAEAAERDRRRAEAAERDLREAGEDAREAQAALDEAERAVTSAGDQHQALQRRVEDLERQLDQLQAESAQDLRFLRHAQRSRDVAARALDGALRRLARAQARADAIRGGGAPQER